MVRGAVQHEIAAIAAAQRGLITMGQLSTLGVPGRSARDWIAAGRMHRVHRGVYAVGHPGLSREARWLAAVLACGDGTALSHRSAAALLGLRADSSGRIDVTAPGRCGRTRGSLVIHRADRLAPAHVTNVSGIPCTTAARTVVDLAAVLRPEAVEYAIHRAQSNRKLARADVAAVVRDLRSRRGTGVVRRILQLTDEAEDDARSRNERRFRRIIKAAGLPAPRGNFWIALNAHPAGGVEVDFAWPGRRVAVEIDSVTYHGSDRAIVNDRRRDRALMLAGWRVIRFADLDLDRALDVAGQMRALL